MSVQPMPDPDKSCYKKTRYESAESASKAVRRNLQIYGAIQETYYCEWCGGYHLTTTQRRRF